VLSAEGQAAGVPCMSRRLCCLAAAQAAVTATAAAVAAAQVMHMLQPGGVLDGCHPG
jgi:hypothetical protein